MFPLVRSCQKTQMLLGTVAPEWSTSADTTLWLEDIATACTDMDAHAGALDSDVARLFLSLSF